MAAYNTYTINTNTGYILYINFYEALWTKFFNDKIRGKTEYKVRKLYSRALWDVINKKDNDFMEKLFGVATHYFSREYPKAKKQCEEIKLDRDAFIKAFTYLGFQPENTGINQKLDAQIAMFQKKLKEKVIDSENISLHGGSNRQISELIGYTGKEKVRIIVRSWGVSPKNLDNSNINKYDTKTANSIIELLNRESIPFNFEEVYSNEKKDREYLPGHDPYHKLTINKNDIFIVIGLYGYNILPEATLVDSPFFRNLFFKWEDPIGKTEFTRILFTNDQRYSVIYRDKKKNEGGISHGIFAKTKYKNYTHILCGGVGQLGTGAMGTFIKEKRKSIYDTIFNKSSNPHSFAVLVELNLDELDKSNILDSVVLSIS